MTTGTVTLHRVLRTTPEKLPQMEIYTYPADHAFNRDIGPQYHEPSATLAWDRTMGFFARELGGA